MIKPNWNKFKAKFYDNPEYYFEYLCYLLFCLEFNKPQGVFRYKNQAGIEWKPVEVGERVIVAQCKFYNSKLREHEKDLLKMLETVHKRYPKANELKFYTNQDWGQGRGKTTNDPKSKIEVEQKAKEYGITLDWRTNEAYFLSPDVALNQDIMKHFFTDESIYDIVYEKQKHTERILDNINTKIKFGYEHIEVNRTKKLEELKKGIFENQVIILAGAGGVGKSAIIKKLYEEKKEEIPFYLFKASEFSITLIDNLFGNYSLQKFIEIHDNYEDKIVVIDSSEKLLDIDNDDPFNEFILALIKKNWKIIFTTRNSYLEDLQYRFSDISIKVPIIHIKNITQKKLLQISLKYNFKIPQDEKLSELIKNPFYLNEYLKLYNQDNGLNYQEFKESVWKSNIKKSKPEREKCFMDLAFKRANEGRFYVDYICSSNSLDLLHKDGILGYENAGYFITHDIYEEWALERIIEKKFVGRDSNLSFFENIGSSLPIRRAFRSWLSEKLLLDIDDIKLFIEDSIDNNEIESFWKDEILVSILLSDYSDLFFEKFEKELLANDYELLNRISFLLRLACKEVDNSIFQQYDLNIDTISLFTISSKPKGKGWKSFIKFIYKHINTIGLISINKILPVLYEWNSKNQNGKTTRFASLVALKYYKLINQEKYKDSHDEYIEKICYVITNGTNKIQKELENIFDEIIKNKWKNSDSNYYELSIMVLSTYYNGIPKTLLLLQKMPQFVLRLAELFWTKEEDKELEHHGIDFDINIANKNYGIVDDIFELEYFPASAFQTPIYYLLKLHPLDTIDFVIDFTNKCVEKYSRSQWEKVAKVKVFIDNEYTILQYHSQALWNICRGTSSPEAPYLLQSIHMALEKYLLEVVKNSKQKYVETILKSLLIRSKSSSITAIIASIVLAYPDKTFNIAIILFKTKEFIQADFIRHFKDYWEVKNLYRISNGFNEINKLYVEERLKTCEDQHRNSQLESLFLNYQIFKSEEVSKIEMENRQKILWKILDNYYEKLPPISKQSENDRKWNIALARMDSRKQDIDFEEIGEDIKITFKAKLDPKIEEYSMKFQEDTSKKFKFSSLYLWIKNRLENNEDYKNYKEFENNPLLALEQLRELLNTKPEESSLMVLEEVFSGTSIVLYRDFQDKLKDEDKGLCKEIILSMSRMPLEKNYSYQISDGTDLAIAYLPLLKTKYINLDKDIKYILILNLFRDHEIGFSGRNVHDNVINAIVSYYDEKEIENFILGYLFLKPKYDSFYVEFLKGNNDVNKNSMIEQFVKKYDKDITKFLNNDLTIKDINFNLRVVTLSVAMKFIKFEKVKCVSLFKQVSKIFLLKVFQPKKRETILKKGYLKYTKKYEDIDFRIKHRLFENLPYLIFKLEVVEIEHYLTPLLENFNAREDVAYLLLEFIKTQDLLNEYEKFWYVWELFEDKIVELCQKGEIIYLDKIIQTYLLAWGPYGKIWKKDAKNWHSLKEKDKRFFKRISSKIGHCPSTLYSISQLLISIGSSYLEDGVSWISNIIKNNKNLLTDELVSNTIFNLEIISREYVLKYSQNIKKQRIKKKEFLEILNFLIEKGSAIGYMLRERIL